jgi:hypothetical protein
MLILAQRVSSHIAETDVFAKTRAVPRFSATPWLDCIAFKLRYLKYKVAEPGYGSTMATVLFLCPNTGDRVQGWFADDGSGDGGETYEGVTCLACRQIHMINPRTGKVLGTDEE